MSRSGCDDPGESEEAVSCNCEASEVPIGTLKAGSCVESQWNGFVTQRAIILEQRSTSTFVETVGGRQTWCSDACVVDKGMVVDFLEKQKQEASEMAKQKRAAKSGSKGTRIVRFEVTDKKPDELLVGKGAKTHQARAYQALAAARSPLTFAEIWQVIGKAVSASTDGKTPKNTVQARLSGLVKDRYLKKTVAHEAPEADARPKAAKAPRIASKPKKAKNHAPKQKPKAEIDAFEQEAEMEAELTAGAIEIGIEEEKRKSAQAANS